MQPCGNERGREKGEGRGMERGGEWRGEKGEGGVDGMRKKGSVYGNRSNMQ